MANRMDRGRAVGALVCAFATSLLVMMLFTGLSSAQSRRGKPKVIQLEEIRIEGRVQKPNAFYILNRSNLGYQILDARHSFLDEIKRSVLRTPF